MTALFHEVGEGQRPTHTQAETRLYKWFPQKTRRLFDSPPRYKATGTERLFFPLVCCVISLQVLSDLSGWKTCQVRLKYLEINLRFMFTLLSLRSKYYSLGLPLRKTPPQSSYCLRACSLKMLSAITITDVIANPQITCANLSKSCQMRFCICSREPVQSPLVVCPW